MPKRNGGFASETDKLRSTFKIILKASRRRARAMTRKHKGTIPRWVYGVLPVATGQISARAYYEKWRRQNPNPIADIFKRGSGHKR